MLQSTQCGYCSHLRSGVFTPNRVACCDAFPEGIPQEVMFNRHDHRLPYEGDHGFRFEPKGPEYDEKQRRLFVRLPVR